MDLMALAPDSPGPLVGRAAELRRLAGLLGLSADDSGRPPESHLLYGGLVLLSGDAGVGKTRLLRELRDKADRNGWRVLAGHCLDFGESALPYLPFSEAFGRLATEAPALATALLHSAPAVARLMPARRLLGQEGLSDAGRADTDPGDADGRSETAMDRGGLFESVHSALEQVGRAAPLLLILEDVHWADRSTRELLSFLFSRQFDGPVSVVASYRSDDLHRRHPLRQSVAEWSRLPGVQRVDLARLPDADVRTLIKHLHDGRLPERAVRRIVERAEGNAFFTEELVAAAGAGGRALPGELADLLLVRLDQLDEPTRRAVRAAAVSGRQVSHALLERVAGLGSDELDAAVRVAVERNVLVPVRDDGYAFRHALLAEAVYNDLLPGERSRLHAGYVQALSSGEIRGTAAELARHAKAANDLPTAARASIDAGDEAMKVAAPDEAAQHYETALELLTRKDVAAALGEQGYPQYPQRLTGKAARALTAAGHVLRAIALAQDQLAGLPPDAPSLVRAQLLYDLAFAAIQADRGPEVLPLTNEALRLLPADGSAADLRAQVMALHARASLYRGRIEDAT
jgi:predicted ATPase